MTKTVPQCQKKVIGNKNKGKVLVQTLYIQLLLIKATTTTQCQKKVIGNINKQRKCIGTNFLCQQNFKAHKQHFWNENTCKCYNVM